MMRNTRLSQCYVVIRIKGTPMFKKRMNERNMRKWDSIPHKNKNNRENRTPRFP